MKKFRKVLDGLTTSTPVNPGGSPVCGSAAGTPSAAHTPRDLEIHETLMSEHFQICKVGVFLYIKELICHCSCAANSGQVPCCNCGDKSG